MNPLIDGLFKQFRISQELDQFSSSDSFELFAASLVLADEILAQSQMTDFLLDAGTVGIDVAVLEINGQIARDVGDVDDLCESPSRINVSFHFIQAKQSSSIPSAEVLGFGDTVLHVLNNGDFGLYPRLNDLTRAFRSIFDKYASKLKSLPVVNLYFVTTASGTAVVDDQVRARIDSVKSQVAGLGFIGHVYFGILGANELHTAWTRKNQANEVELQLEKQVNLPKMPGVDQAILGVVAISELLKLAEDDNGLLDERVFYDNVRGFKGIENSVNRQIMDTLRSDERKLLPVLNNGVTVVAGSYSPKPGDAISISGYQIVNGCQTSHCLHLAKASLGADIDKVFVPLRLVVTSDEDVATRIIRATNSQTEVHENDLVALTKFQKRLEDFYRLDPAAVKLTYERRSGQFYGQEVTKTRVITIIDQMRAVSAVFLDLPHLAARYPKSLYDDVGESIFRDDHKLMPYVASAFAAYKLENAFRWNLDASFKPVRYHILMTFKYDILGVKSSPLESGRVEQQSLALIEALKRQDVTEAFRKAAEAVVRVGNGSLPSTDRLKRQQFTQDLLTEILRQR